MSGVMVPMMSRSTSDGSQPAAFRQRVAAWAQRSLVAWWGGGEPALVDARPVDDPFGVEPVGRP